MALVKGTSVLKSQHDMSPSDQLGYTGATLQEVLQPNQPMEVRKISLVRALKLFIQIHHAHEK